MQWQYKTGIDRILTSNYLISFSDSNTFSTFFTWRDNNMNDYNNTTEGGFETTKTTWKVSRTSSMANCLGVFIFAIGY